MFYDTINGLLRVLVIGPVTYAWLIAVLRVTGKRTLAQLNAFDFIVTVALGSTLATVVLSSTVAWVEGALAFALLAVLQFIVAVISVHSSGSADADLGAHRAVTGRKPDPGCAAPRAHLP